MISSENMTEAQSNCVFGNEENINNADEMERMETEFEERTMDETDQNNQQAETFSARSQEPVVGLQNKDNDMTCWCAFIARVKERL